MPFEFVCPFCHHRTKVDDKYAGQSGPCASCGRNVDMPEFDERGILIHRPTALRPRQIPKPEHRNPLVYVAVSGSLLLILASTVIAGVLFFPLIQKRTLVAAQSRDLDHMKAIATALNQYADRYGTYPPPTTFSAKGAPLYSWRVLILPQLGYESLYEQFKLDQPFDSPANLAIITKMPAEFTTHTAQFAAPNQSCYSLITGVGTLFPPEGPMSPKNIDDPTLLLVETKVGFLQWTQPGDINISDGLRPGARPGKDLGGIFKDSFLAVSTSEEGFRFPNSVSGNIIDSLVSPLGNEKVDVSPFQD